MGKYCVRFGSDIYQFCSNSCLERYKNNIQVCCYCQKNLIELSSKEKSLIITVNNAKVKTNLLFYEKIYFTLLLLVLDVQSIAN